jgi:YcxB-like protein
MEVTLHYDETLVRKAVWRFCWRKVGWVYPVVLLAMVISLGVMIGAGNRSWLTGAYGTILLFALSMPMALYCVQLTGTLGRYHRLAGKPALFSATDQMITIRSAGGMVEFPWHDVSEVWQYDDCWLLLLGGHFLTFPLTGVSPDARAYVIERVLANGGKVS